MTDAKKISKENGYKKMAVTGGMLLAIFLMIVMFLSEED